MSPHDDLRVRALARCVALSGGEARLSSYLGISGASLRAMLYGSAMVSEQTFMVLVDLLVARNLADLKKPQDAPESSERP